MLVFCGLSCYNTGTLSEEEKARVWDCNASAIDIPSSPDEVRRGKSPSVGLQPVADYLSFMGSTSEEKSRVWDCNYSIADITAQAEKVRRGKSPSVGLQRGGIR